MLFKQSLWPGIADGSVTVAFRRWKRPRVVAGNRYRTGGGLVEVTAVEAIDSADITPADATNAGFAHVDDVVADLRPGSDRRLYRVRFRATGEPDPRDELSHQTDLDDHDRTWIQARLDRMDARSDPGPWTMRTLELIRTHPGTRAPDLAGRLGQETAVFKRNVRKLKELGLTHSLRVGYRLSPRGEAFLAE